MEIDDLFEKIYQSEDLAQQRNNFKAKCNVLFCQRLSFYQLNEPFSVNLKHEVYVNSDMTYIRTHDKYYCLPCFIHVT